MVRGGVRVGVRVEVGVGTSSTLSWHVRPMPPVLYVPEAQGSLPPPSSLAQHAPRTVVPHVEASTYYSPSPHPSPRPVPNFKTPRRVAPQVLGGR